MRRIGAEVWDPRKVPPGRQQPEVRKSIYSYCRGSKPAPTAWSIWSSKPSAGLLSSDRPSRSTPVLADEVRGTYMTAGAQRWVSRAARRPDVAAWSIWQSIFTPPAPSSWCRRSALARGIGVVEFTEVLRYIHVYFLFSNTCSGVYGKVRVFER